MGSINRNLSFLSEKKRGATIGAYPTWILLASIRRESSHTGLDRGKHVISKEKFELTLKVSDLIKRIIK